MAGAAAEEEEHTTITMMITRRMGLDFRKASWVVLPPDKFCAFSVLSREAFCDVPPELLSTVHTEREFVQRRLGTGGENGLHPVSTWREEG